MTPLTRFSLATLLTFVILLALPISAAAGYDAIGRVEFDGPDSDWFEVTTCVLITPWHVALAVGEYGISDDFGPKTRIRFSKGSGRGEIIRRVARLEMEHSDLGFAIVALTEPVGQVEPVRVDVSAKDSWDQLEIVGLELPSEHANRLQKRKFGLLEVRVAKTVHNFGSRTGRFRRFEVRGEISPFSSGDDRAIRRAPIFDVSRGEPRLVSIDAEGRHAERQGADPHAFRSLVAFYQAVHPMRVGTKSHFEARGLVGFPRDAVYEPKAHAVLAEWASATAASLSDAELDALAGYVYGSFSGNVTHEELGHVQEILADAFRARGAPANTSQQTLVDRSVAFFARCTRMTGAHPKIVETVASRERIADYEIVAEASESRGSSFAPSLLRGTMGAERSLRFARAVFRHLNDSPWSVEGLVWGLQGILDERDELNEKIALAMSMKGIAEEFEESLSDHEWKYLDEDTWSYLEQLADALEYYSGRPVLGLYGKRDEAVERERRNQEWDEESSDWSDLQIAIVYLMANYARKVIDFDDSLVDALQRDVQEYGIDLRGLRGRRDELVALAETFSDLRSLLDSPRPTRDDVFTYYVNENFDRWSNHHAEVTGQLRALVDQHPEAMWCLEMLYRYGVMGIGVDLEEAARWEERYRQVESGVAIEPLQRRWVWN